MLSRSLLLLVLAATPALADPPVVQNVKATRSGDSWTFDVTVRHNDSGWDHYVDAWRIMDPEGKELGIRNLAHPHTGEQPFTRSLSHVVVPEGMTEVGVQARDSNDGWTSEVKRVPLP